VIPASPVPARRSLLLPGAQLTDLASIRSFLGTSATELGVAAATIPDVVIAVNEAVANIIRHGYKGAPGPIEIEVERDRDTIVVRLRDEAPAFDPTMVPSPDLTVPLEDRRAGGLGIYLTRTCMDDVTHSALLNEGNELTLTKSLRAKEGGTAG
jgi:serine/threonine-protein kinase RsbW